MFVNMSKINRLFRNYYRSRRPYFSVFLTIYDFTITRKNQNIIKVELSTVRNPCKRVQEEYTKKIT